MLIIIVGYRMGFLLTPPKFGNKRNSKSSLFFLKKLMKVIDQINARMGKGTMKLASEGADQLWKMKQGRRSPGYTTDWNELVAVEN